MDDYLTFFDSKQKAEQGREQMQLTLQYLGLQWNPKKSVWTPSQRLRHLGLDV